jgi:hypothetical protein
MAEKKRRTRCQQKEQRKNNNHSYHRRTGMINVGLIFCKDKRERKMESWILNEETNVETNQK